MRPSAEPGTPLALLLGVALAVVMGAGLSGVPVSLALGVGVGLVIVIAALASTELALYLLIGSMLLSPEAIVGGLGPGSTLGRGITLRADDVLVVLVGFAWLAKTALHKELGLALRTPLNAPIAAYSLVAVLATGFGVIGGRVGLLAGSLFVFKYIEYFIIYFMVVNHLRDRRQFERFLVALLVTAALVSLAALPQIPSGARVTAPFEGAEGEPNTFGGYLVLMLSLVGGLILSGARRRSLLAGLAVLLFVPLLFTLSRGSYVGLLAAAGVLVVLSPRRLLLGVVLALALVVAPVLAPHAVVDRIFYLVTQDPEPGQIAVGGMRLDTSTSQRLISWRQAVLDDWPHHPLFGHGVTGTRFLDAQYPRVLLETGLLGLLAFLWLQGTLLRRAYQLFKAARDPVRQGVCLGFLAGLVGLTVHAIGANTFVIVRIMEPFWFLAGMVMMVPRLEAAHPPPGAEAVPGAAAITGAAPAVVTSSGSTSAARSSSRRRSAPRPPSGRAR